MQSSPALQQIVEQVSQEKGIDSAILLEATEQAILMAAKKTFGTERELEARFNTETGMVDLFQYMTVVEEVDNEEREIAHEDAVRHGLEAEIGEELGFQVFYLPEDADRARQQDREFGNLLHLKQHRQGFGRIAAQTAKQVIVSRVRDAERERVYNDFKDRQGEILTGIVRRFERGSNIVVDIGKGIEAVLPSREQAPRESYRPGDRIVALLKNIDREQRGQQLILSRTDVGLLVKLFEMEVPEIYEGIVRIVGASREPGARSKIAVASRDSDVDPVGACVGMKGSRVQAVVQELRGEKIDIVPWDKDPARFVCNAIAPAEVVRVIIDEVNHGMELVVPDAKLSLAIGRRGQNVRLASRLTAWHLEIIGESRFRELEDEVIRSFERIPSVEGEQARELYRLGFRSLDEVAEATEEELVSLGSGIAGDTASFRSHALVALEELRLDRLEALRHDGSAVDERRRLRLVRGVTERVAQALEQAGYGSVERLAAEDDSDRLALKSGLELQRALEIKQAAETFLHKEWPSVEAAIAAQRANQAKLAAEAQATAESATDGADEAQNRRSSGRDGEPNASEQNTADGEPSPAQPQEARSEQSPSPAQTRPEI